MNSSTQPDSNIFPSLSIVVEALFPSFVLFFHSKVNHRSPQYWSFLTSKNGSEPR